MWQPFKRTQFLFVGVLINQTFVNSQEKLWFVVCYQSVFSIELDNQR